MNLSKIPKIPGFNFPWKHSLKNSGNLPESFRPFATLVSRKCINIYILFSEIFFLHKWQQEHWNYYLFLFLNNILT